MTSVTERVAAGAAYLDEHDPGWWRADVERAIDLRFLDLQHADLCILGQRCPLETIFNAPEWMDRYDAYAALLSKIPACDRSDLDGWAMALGFQAEPAEYDDEVEDYEALTAEWRRVIEARRSA